MGDPLFSHGVTLAVVLIVLLKVVVAFAVLLVSVLMVIWFERKLISDMQNRIGPNRAGPFGLLQSLADGIKLFFKEDLLPAKAERRVFRLAPYLSAVPAFLSFVIVPVGGSITIAHHRTYLQVADPPVGILFLLAMSSVSVYGVMLAGWSSGSKYPLLGSVRASAQMISYEAAMGLSIASVVLVSHTLTTSGIVASQHDNWWNIVRTIFVPFFVFLVAVTAELNRPPFDLVEAEQELVGGYMTEYSSVRFALFYLAEFMNMITMSAIVVTLFLGGPDGPAPHVVRWLWPILWFAAKTVAFVFCYVWARAALPRLRYDQLMNLGWRYLIPGSLWWLLVVAARQISAAWAFAVFGAGLVAAGVLAWVVRLARAHPAGPATVPAEASGAPGLQPVSGKGA
ncbi:MAG TPA: NADH-quinone oxidoreductase subunit NuoH [Acidimicrobiales bacterium]|nr:NADH-quinone oxidoreductase subunit NuoH [Acidimicrobiales bacterium]